MHLSLSISSYHFRIADFTDFQFTSISAATSVANSPILIRRDSILKHSGSIKHNEKRVSIKHDQPAFVEYLSEKRIPTTVPQSNSIPVPVTSNARPASLILSGRGDKPTFKLVRSASIEHAESVEQLDATSAIEQHSSLMMNNLNVRYATTKDDDDESMPLVQTDSNGTSKILSGQNNTGNL